MTANRETIAAQNVDLSNCDREQVQFCNAIQPHGILLVLDEPGFTIRRASANTNSLLGLTLNELLGQSIDRVLGRRQGDQFRELVRHEKNLTGPPTCLLTTSVPGPMTEAHVFTHRNQDGLLMVELESKGEAGRVSLPDLYSEVRASMAQLERTESLLAFFNLAVTRIRHFTGYDRVLAYQFLEDGSGRVLAEDREEGLESYVGLHYPASDIPEPARRLFSMKWISHLPNADYAGVPGLAADGVDGNPGTLAIARAERSWSCTAVSLRPHNGSIYSQQRVRMEVGWNSAQNFIPSVLLKVKVLYFTHHLKFLGAYEGFPFGWRALVYF